MPCPNCVCPSCRALIGSSISTPDKLLLPSSDLITTYFPPTYSEVVHSQDIICSAEKTVPLIQAMIDDLEKRKAGVLSLARMHRAVVSPLRSFPPELLVNIFAAFIAMAACYPTPRWRCSPFALMGICSRWRKIILDTPQLWTRIMGVPPMIDSWIIQSKGLPLNLE
ncbi:hypothetical protein BD779DRAFT_919167 [Infundibulicybe gibba]|nr:hypothetical protein BD779DRAFT_919167 [Infundibulicybe gibba]